MGIDATSNRQLILPDVPGESVSISFSLLRRRDLPGRYMLVRTIGKLFSLCSLWRHIYSIRKECSGKSIGIISFWQLFLTFYFFTFCGNAHITKWSCAYVLSFMDMTLPEARHQRWSCAALFFCYCQPGIILWKVRCRFIFSV